MRRGRRTPRKIKARDTSWRYTLNPQNVNRTTTITKSIIQAISSTLTVNAPTNAMLTFDPSGAGGANSGSIGTGGLWTPAANAIDQWAAYSVLYQFYKVDWIKLRFRWLNATTTAAGQYQAPVMFSRYFYDPDLGSGGAAADVMEEWPNVVVTSFPPERQMCTFKVFPRVMQPVDVFTATSLPRSYTPAKMPWTDTTRGVVLYGFAFHVTGIPTGWQLLVDFTYRIRFKTPR